ncbi:pentapeptide repeat-containing protein [Nocardia callitridis]|uniref:Pentapeptide repeat-containing protein n=1 Tax=Nocardia callitridis TaxID=648753 RepID=A0ABP9L072_9NOCA
MTRKYGRSREDVAGWPSDAMARKSLDEYFGKLATLPDSVSTTDSLLCADGLNFSGADLSGLDLQGAAFNESNLANVRAVEVDLYQAWMLAAIVENADFSRSDLRKIEGRGCRADYVSFREAVLQGSTFENSSLCGADLCKADLRDVDFSDSDMRNANLRGCVFSWTDLSGCRLDGCVVDGAAGTVLGPIKMEAGDVISGYQLQEWFSANGAPAVTVQN